MSYFFNWVLFGVLSSQVCKARFFASLQKLWLIKFHLDSYHITFRKKDLLVLRSVVYFTYALEVTHTFILMVTGYNTFVKRFGDVSALTSWKGDEWTALPVIGSAGAIVRVSRFPNPLVLTLPQYSSIHCAKSLRISDTDASTIGAGACCDHDCEYSVSYRSSISIFTTTLRSSLWPSSVAWSGLRSTFEAWTLQTTTPTQHHKPSPA